MGERRHGAALIFLLSIKCLDSRKRLVFTTSSFSQNKNKQLSSEIINAGEITVAREPFSVGLPGCTVV